MYQTYETLTVNVLTRLSYFIMNISDIFVTGDNLLNEDTARKFNSLCEQSSLSDCIDDYTHFTEHSFTLNDILFVSNNKHLIASGVAEPFLEQDI